MTRPHTGDGNAAGPPPREDERGDGEPKLEAALHERFAANEKALVETREALLRTLADQDNSRKLAARERDEAVRYAAAQLARDLLESLDNLRRAVESAHHGDSADSLLSGVVATERNLLAALAATTTTGLALLTPRRVLLLILKTPSPMPALSPN